MTVSQVVITVSLLVVVLRVLLLPGFICGHHMSVSTDCVIARPPHLQVLLVCANQSEKLVVKSCPDSCYSHLMHCTVVGLLVSCFEFGILCWNMDKSIKLIIMYQCQDRTLIV